ncbi:MAG TPA: phosphatidate cytidylyltransferase [bacterium]|nr:phosphatidate cytidylyltransferase [bacterium]
MKDWKRYVTGLSLMPLVLVIVYYLPQNFFVYLMMITAFFGFSEYLKMFNEKKEHLFVPFAVLMMILVETMSGLGPVDNFADLTIGQISTSFDVIRQFILIIISAAALIPILSLFGSDPVERKFKRMTLYLSGFFYLGLGFGLFPLVRNYRPDHQWMAFALIVPWICDTAAYFGGRFFGRHKFSPVISPNKTWEGAISGAAFSIIAGLIFGYFFLKSEGMLFVGMVAFLIGILGQLGDLAESLIKRGAGVKDSGTLFPGHGGILDRTDSLLISVTVIYVSLLLKNHGL